MDNRFSGILTICKYNRIISWVNLNDFGNNLDTQKIRNEIENEVMYNLKNKAGLIWVRGNVSYDEFGDIEIKNLKAFPMGIGTRG